MKKEILVFNIITELISHYSAKEVEAEDIKLEDKLLNYFPTPLNEEDVKKKYNEHANRFGEVMWNTAAAVKDMIGFELKYDLEPRQEWELFETVEDFWMYVVAKINGLDK